MKVFLDLVGCRLNQAEIENYARQFRAAGHSLTADPGEADLVVINTCAVTKAAAADSRKKIRHAARAGAKEIEVTGCWSTLNPEVAARLPSVRQVIPNADKDHLVPLTLGLPEENFDLEPVERLPIPGTRLRTRAFIKVQDGCDNRCTFCVTTIARGRGRSRPIREILGDVNAALHAGESGSDGIRSGGAKEIVLTGVHLGSWGQDFSSPLHLRQLIEAILKDTDVPRLRLSSLEPWDLDEEFFSLWDDPRLCRHLHLPLQSGCEATLRRMARKTTPKSFAALVEAARQAVPAIAITTDVMAGFPGETQAEFAESLAFVREMNFAGGHVFTYSSRSGTAAARMPVQIPHSIRKERNAQLRASLAESARRYRQCFLGQSVPVLCEGATALGPKTWHLSGLTDNYLRVSAEAPRDMWNEITPVRLTHLKDDGLQGEMCLAGSNS
jgi:threonylcarbamoyladenosine tRNA methylthiotransferase MtaB